MGMPAAHPDVSTIEELLALPEDGMRHELLDGVHVVTPAPRFRHQRALLELLTTFAAHLQSSHEWTALPSPADVILGPRTLVQPDVFVVPSPADQDPDWRDVARPILAVEFLSPSTAARDRGEKRTIYQMAGIAEYWIVDLDARLVERWRPEDERPEVLRESITWQPGAGDPVLTIDLMQLFERVSGG